MKLPHTEVKFYPEVKSQTGLSSLRASCKRALRRPAFLDYPFLVTMVEYTVFNIQGYFLLDKIEGERKAFFGE